MTLISYNNAFQAYWYLATVARIGHIPLWLLSLLSFLYVSFFFNLNNVLSTSLRQMGIQSLLLTIYRARGRSYNLHGAARGERSEVMNYRPMAYR